MDSYLGIPGNHLGKTFDKFLELVPTGTELSVASNPILIGDGLIDADLVLDIAPTAARETVAAPTVKLQFCKKEDFSADTVDGITIPTKSETGRIIAPFRNDPTGGEPLPYVRLVPSASVTLGAFIAKK